MENQSSVKITERKWFYVIVYLLFSFISFLPLYTEEPYTYQDIQDVIISLLMVTSAAYAQLGVFFHIITLIMIFFMVRKPNMMRRFFPAFMGLNYLVIAFAQSIGRTEKYGLVIFTGNLIISLVLGLAWLGTSIFVNPKISFQKIRWYHIVLLPFAILPFWSPVSVVGNAVLPDFDPLRLLVSADYGLTFCFTTPVFLYLILLFYPPNDIIAIRITAFNGLLFAFFNLTHWINPDSRWMGVMHLPLLVTSIAAILWIPKIAKNKT